MSRTAPQYRQWIRDFAPGFLDVPEPDTLPPGATPDAQNGMFININILDRSAKLAKRSGSRMLNPSAMVAGAKVDGLFEFRQANGSRRLAAICGGKLFEFDGTDTFTPVGVTAPWTTGRPARVEFFADQAFIVDGTAQKRWDGAALHDVGQAAPTSVTAMTAAGTGLTGTYEARYTWYDPTTDHESSPSDITATLSLTNQGRRHTQPGGTPGATYTKWRAYVRRVDTNETKFGRVGTFDVGSGTQDEAVIDAARRDFVPTDGDREPPPAPWAILKQIKSGEFIGVPKDSSEVYVSRIGDPQSWNLRNQFFVRKGDGEPITGVKTFGEETIIQKPHRSFRLVGDSLPYVPRQIHSSYGGVSQESGLEVDGKFYDWDRERGPYVTDLLTWAALADGRVWNLIKTVNRGALDDIKCVHAEGLGLVGWTFATGGASRKRTILWWNYLLGCWLPPWTGLEYGAFSAFTDSTGRTGVYVGDEWGRVYELFSGDREGVPGATPVLRGIVASGTTDTVTIDGGGLYTDGDGLAGLPVAVRPEGGTWEWRRIERNTTDTITLDTAHNAPFTEVPVSGWEIIIGGINWYHRTPWFDGQVPHLQKTLHFLFLQGRSTSSAHEIQVRARFDDDATAVRVAVPLAVSDSSAVWGVAVWGASLWGTTTRRMRKHRIDRTVFSAQFELSNVYPDQPLEVTAFGFTGDVTDTTVPSV